MHTAEMVRIQLFDANAAISADSSVLAIAFLFA